MSIDAACVVSGDANEPQGLRPKLRFPEFRDAEDWKLRELSELLTERKEKNRQLEYGPEHVLSVSGEHGCVNQIQFMGRSYAGASVRDYNVVHTGDIVYTKSPLKACPNGIIKENKGQAGIVSVLYAVYRPKAAATSDFIDYYFSSNHKLNTYLQPLVKKGPKNSILVSNSEVLKGRIGVPALVEQRKVGECLSSLDALIAAEEERLATLRGYKKGLMQQLLPAEGKITPRLRFPEFRNAPEWARAELGSIADVKLGKMLDKKRAGSGEPYRYLNNMAVRWNYIETKDLPTMGFEAPELDRFGLMAGDVLVCEGGEPGRAAVWNGVDHAVKFQKAIHRVRFNVPYEPNLFVTYLEAIAETDSFKSILTGEGIKHLTRENFLKLRVPIIDEAEHAKINSTFVSVNDLLRETAERVSFLKGHKAGLLQHLFVSPAGDAG